MDEPFDKYILKPAEQDIRKAWLDDIRSRVQLTCHCMIAIVRAIEKEYGPEGKEIARKGLVEYFANVSGQVGKDVQENILQAFCQIDKSWAGTHKFKRLEDTAEKVAYEFTGCMWADEFNRLDAADIGKWFCDCDEPLAKAFNPNIAFKRTKTLMESDDTCDHVFYLKDKKK